MRKGAQARSVFASAVDARVGGDLSLPRADFSEAYKFYVVGVIWLVLLFRVVDLQIVAVLLESIRAEFRVSDTQLGLLSGTAFALFYATLGLPIAWLADRYNRRTIIAACLALWSGMTALCGTASSFPALFLSRVGVGVGEAGGVPPSYSLISDYFPASRRSTILAVLNCATPMGVFAGFIIGGYINVRLGWRATLVILGAAGLIVALIVRLTLREPVRGGSDGRAAAPPPALWQTVRELWRVRSYRHLVLATSIATLGSVGSGIWLPSFFIRLHHMAPLEVSTWLAFIYGGGGLVGALLGGRIADRLARRSGDRRWQAWACAIGTAGVVPFSFFVFLWSNPITALLVHIGTTVMLHSWLGPAYASVQSLVPANRRAMAAAINMLVVNLLALGLGPLLVGAASDWFQVRFGADSLRYSILTLLTVSFTWATLHFLLAARRLDQDLESAANFPA